MGEKKTKKKTKKKRRSAETKYYNSRLSWKLSSKGHRFSV